MQERRSFLFSAGALAISQLFPQGAEAQTSLPDGFVLSAEDGEHLIHFRDRGNFFIKLGLATGSSNLAMGTQQVMPGTGIPIHRHLKVDEAFLVLAGSGTFILDEVRHPFEKGATIFIPRNSWHGFENPDHELLLLWMISPAGFEGFFRDTCDAPSKPAKNLSREEIRKIAQEKYDTEFK